MNFLDWMNMSMVVDIAFLVFTVAIIWKFRKLEKKTHQLEQDLLLIAKNPKDAKRLLKERN